MPDSERLVHCVIPAHHAGRRLDQALADIMPDCSRTRLQRWIKDGHIRIDGQIARPKDRVLGGEEISGSCPQEIATSARAQNIALDTVYEDDVILVINKPAGLVVHPAAGNADGTLLNALLNYDAGLERVPRAGIVHRLDKDTSGLLVVARTLPAHKQLVEQLQARSVKREYQAVCSGVLLSGGTVNAPIGRHPVERKRMAVVAGGKPAVTHYTVLERFRAHTLLQARLETGRTHQIRVHLAHIRFPLLGDPVYGARLRLPADIQEKHADIIRSFRRQALHAARLGLTHPASGGYRQWQVDPPADFMALLSAIRNDYRDSL